MLDFLLSKSGFLTMLAMFAAGAVGSLLARKNDKLANATSGAFAVIGSATGLLIAVLSIATGRGITFSAELPAFRILSFSFNVDKLSAFFIAVISLIAIFCSVYSFGYVKHYYKKYNLGSLGFFYNLFIAGMMMVVSSSNGLFFLIVWEIMSLASYFLVVYDRRDEDNVKAGFLYLIMTHVGTAFIILSFLLFYKFTGSFDFGAIKSGIGLVPPLVKNLIFIFAIIGFGTKAGIIPFHIWLPAAHPAAPSHVSALMSGVMIKTGIYMMIRLFIDVLQPTPVWWGVVLLVVGAASSLLGVLYALTEHDIKKLLAYHSIENIGIILLGVGGSMVFFALKMPAVAAVGLAAALFHTLNHAAFKSLLFLGAGSVINQTHTRNMEEYGGLIKLMPLTAVFFLIGSMAISALPPFNGFFSEWLTFQSLFYGISSLGFYFKLLFILAAGALASTGGLALACFVKAFGATFLARPRSAEAAHAKESPFFMTFGMGGLAVLCALLGIFSGYVVAFIGQVINSFKIADAPSLIAPSAGRIAAGNFSFVSAPLFFLALAIALGTAAIIFKYLINKNQKINVGATWDCGVDLTPRMEITATGFARSIVVIFKSVLRPNAQCEKTISENKYLPLSRAVHLTVRDVYQRYFYRPVGAAANFLSARVRSVQNGNVNSYILYIFIALTVVLIMI
jgi:hydrogenase-4 component B